MTASEFAGTLREAAPIPSEASVLQALGAQQAMGRDLGAQNNTPVSRCFADEGSAGSQRFQCENGLTFNLSV